MKERFVIYGTKDKPLKIGKVEIQCYVLDDETRVLAGRSFSNALASGKKKPSQLSGQRFPRIGKYIRPYLDDEAIKQLDNPIIFKVRGRKANGYDARLLPKICDAILEASDQNIKAFKKDNSYYDAVIQADIIRRGIGIVGIIGLVDEVTGYQDVRAKNAIQEILDNFISEKLRPWTKTFPDPFYKEMFRLKGWKYINSAIKKRPKVVGKITKDIVYSRLAPAVLEELEKKNPRDEKWRRKNKHFQHVTKDVGYPKLKEHLSAVITLMKASTNWNSFYRGLQRALPRYDKIELIVPKFPEVEKLDEEIENQKSDSL